MGDKTNNENLANKASEHILGPNPVVGVPARDLVSTARMVLRQTVKQPLHSIRHLGRLGMAVTDVMLGRSQLAPSADDRRFVDPTWSQNPLYRRYISHAVRYLSVGE